MTGEADPPSHPAFELRHAHDRVELVLYPAHEAAPSVEAISAELRSTAVGAVDSMTIARALSTHARNPHGTLVTTVGYPYVLASTEPPCTVVMSLDRLAAFIVPVLPPARPATAAASEAPAEPLADAGDSVVPEPEPEPAPALLTAAELRQRLADAGVVAGLLDDVIDAYGDGMVPEEICCVARGVRAVPGVDARLEYHIESEAPGAPVGVGEGAIDLHALSAHRFVVEHTPLVTHWPAIPGTPGFDVRGTVLEPPPVRETDLQKVAGANTEVTGDTLAATIAGRPVVNPRGAVDVLPVFEVAGNLDFHVGNIEFPGDVIVRGDVRPGFSIKAGGSVTISGLVEGASITAGHDLSVLGTVGEHRTTLEVGGNLRARYLHTTDARVTGAVTVASEIVSCSIAAASITTNSQGRVVGGYIEAVTTIDTGTFGSKEGRSTEVCVTSEEPDAVIRARRAVEPGLLLSVGGRSLPIRDEISSASFWNVNGVVVTLPAGADLAAAEARRAEEAA